MSNLDLTWSPSLFGAILVVSGLAWASSPVQAQQIRRYGDQSEESDEGGGGGQQGSRMVYPGQPMPQPEQKSQKQGTRRGQRSQSGKKSGQSQTTGSYEIRVHEPKQQMERGRRRPTMKPLNKPAEKMYQGIIPGKRDSVEHLKKENSGTNKLTWIGFQPEDELTRIFIQTSHEPDYEIDEQSDGRQIVVTLENTEYSDANFQHHIDASYFERVVKKIETKATGDATIEIRIALRSAETHSVEASENYLYIDFPHESAGDESSQGEE